MIACGVVTTTADLSLAETIFASSAEVPAVERSHANVYTRFCIAEEKVVRKMLNDMGSSAAGMHWTTRYSPCASISEMRGDTTEVLPAPMIICLTIER